MRTVLALGLCFGLTATAWGQHNHPGGSFRVSWQPGLVSSTIEGHVFNDSPFPVRDVRVHIEGLDAGNHRVGERLAWVSDDIAPGGGTSYFAETIPGAVGYRVSVFSFDVASRGEAPQAP